MLPPIPPGWREVLGDATLRPSYRNLERFLDQERADGQTVLPPAEDIFRALALTPYDQVRVVLLGQDPYPTPGHAHGLCFSVRAEVRPLPGSLRNIYKELRDDVGLAPAAHGCLEAWALQGLLLLNTVLTVRARAANSHQGQGWEAFTDHIIELVNARPSPVVFVLWGRQAQKKRALIRQPHHRVIECAHPSPLSAKRFLGCRCFSAINRHLEHVGHAPIAWRLPILK